jgi:hypothetical protein
MKFFLGKIDPLTLKFNNDVLYLFIYRPPDEGLCDRNKLW